MPKSGPLQDPEGCGGIGNRSGVSQPPTHRGVQTLSELPSHPRSVGQILTRGIALPDSLGVDLEEHWRDGDAVKSKSEVIGYYPYEHAGKKYLAPKYYKSGTLNYICTTGSGRLNYENIKPYRWTLYGTGISSGIQPSLAVAKKRTNNWYDCILLK